MINDISESTITKTEMGDNRAFGVTLGLVVKNYDKKHPGYLYVSIPTHDKGDDIFQWARLAMGSGGKGWGQYFMPEIGDQVLLAFEDGLFERPFVIGCVPRDGDAFLKDSFHEKNQVKRIVTSHGSTIQFDDCDGDKGEKDKILIQTAQKSHQILMDNENKKIVISDKDGKNAVEMNTESGEMTVTAEKKLTIKVGAGVSIVINDDSGSINIKCNELKVTASRKIALASDGDVVQSGSQVKISANSSMKVESDGMVMVKGSTISLG